MSVSTVYTCIPQISTVQFVDSEGKSIRRNRTLPSVLPTKCKHKYSVCMYICPHTKDYIAAIPKTIEVYTNKTLPVQERAVVYMTFKNRVQAVNYIRMYLKTVVGV